ncbi:MAG: site-2 protease family protein [Gemmataceae bacterium]|nr:site-2 protease family protein [Gemmataceae bacterium]MDW8267464.1 site-2 protease family protein [Gemmataceae bacterium]
MNGDIYLGKVLGIPFRLHWSWFLAIFLIAWTLARGFFPRTLPEMDGEGGVFWVLGILAALGLFVSVLLHELGHALMARRLGVPVRGIRLFVFGGVAELGSEPKKPSHEILIAIAGPLVTVALIVFYELALGLILASSGVHWQLTDGLLHNLQGGSPWAAGACGLLFYLGFINLVVLLFNLVPAFPLDGGRVLRGLVWAATGNYLTSTRIAGGVGIGFAYLLFVAGILMVLGGNLLGGVWFFFLGMFLQHAAQSSIAYAQLQQLLGGVRVADMMQSRPVVIEAGTRLRDVVEQYLLRFPYKVYPVIRQGDLVGLLTLRAVQQTPRERWDELRAEDIAAPREAFPVVRPQEPVLQALRKLAESGHSRLPVVDNGSLVGLLCGRDVMELVKIRAGLGPGFGSPTAGAGPTSPVA